MKAILQFLKREALWPLVVLLLGAIIILPGLGDYGFWEPQEIRIADRAKQRVSPHDDDQEASKTAPQSVAKDKKPTAEDIKPPLTEWSAGQSMKRFDSRSFGARLPLAVLGLIALLAAFALGRRLASARAGLLSGLVLMSFPLFLFQSRQLMSDIGAVTGSALTVLGLIGLAWPVGHRPNRHQDRYQGNKGRDLAEQRHVIHAEQPMWLYAVDLALVAIGVTMSYYASAVLLGVVVPFGAVALACLAALIGKLHAERDASCALVVGRVRDRQVWLAIGLALIGFTAVLVMAIGFAFERADRILAYAFVPALLGVGLVVVGMMPRKLRYRLSADASWRRWHLLAVGLFALTVAFAALLVVLAQVFDLKDPIPGDRALFGHSIMAVDRPLEVLGGQWQQHTIQKATFDVHFEQIAFGLFPWVILAPIAITHVAIGLRRGRLTWSGYVLFAWASLAWLVCALLARKVGPVLYPALVPIAVAIGMWLDDLLDARDQADATTESEHEARARFGLPLRMPLVALFVFLAAVALATNIVSFPDEFLSVNLAGETIQYPKGPGTEVLKLKLSVWVAIFGGLQGLSLAMGLFLWASHKRLHRMPRVVFAMRRYGIHAACALGLLFAVFLTQVWTPKMSGQFSSKDIFAKYRELHEEGDELGLLGQYGSAPDHYLKGEYQTLKSQGELIQLLAKDRRTFAMVPSNTQCSLNRSLTQRSDYYVLERNAKHLLLSNRLRDGERDLNPLADIILKQRPTDISTPMSVNFDDRIELIGVDIPTSVHRGDSFTMTMYYKVLKQVSGSWKVFVHFDGGGSRFQGDHDPIEGLCSTNFWQPGDYIVDRFTVEAGDITYPRTSYAVHVGFFQGSHGNWKNMNVTSADSPSGTLSIGSDKRVRIDELMVQ